MNNRRKIDGVIRSTAVKVQQELDRLYASTESLEGSSLDQAGLQDGLNIVEEYLHHGEYGLALEHLVYMISEPPIAISDTQRSELLDVAALMGIADKVKRSLKTT